MRDPVGTHARIRGASFYLLDFLALLMVTRPQNVLVFVFDAMQIVSKSMGQMQLQM